MRERERERYLHIELNSRQSVLVFDVFVHIECKYVLNCFFFFFKWKKKLYEEVRDLKLSPSIGSTNAREAMQLSVKFLKINSQLVETRGLIL